MTEPLDYAAPVDVQPSARMAWISLSLAFFPILVGIVATLAETEAPNGSIVDPVWAPAIPVIGTVAWCFGLSFGIVAVKQGIKAPAIAGIVANSLFLAARLFT